MLTVWKILSKAQDGNTNENLGKGGDKEGQSPGDEVGLRVLHALVNERHDQVSETTAGVTPVTRKKKMYVI